MVDHGGAHHGPRGCLAAGAAFTALTLISPFAAVFRMLRRWIRGDDAKHRIETGSFTSRSGANLCRIDCTLDVPEPPDPGYQRGLTDSLIRVAEHLRYPDDVYHLVYRRPGDEEPVLVSIGPQLQEFGERVHLVHNQARLAGLTLVWLTIGRGNALASVVDPVTVDPETDGGLHALLGTPEARWSMATSWARVGPSHVVRLILVVPEESAGTVSTLLDSIV